MAAKVGLHDWVPSRLSTVLTRGQSVADSGAYDPAQLARIVEELTRQPEEQYTLQVIVDHVVENIPGCDLCGVSIRRAGRRVETPASTDELVGTLDSAQYDLGEGPCLDALWEHEIFVARDLRDEGRWPRWSPIAVEHGVRSVLSVRLATEDAALGSINLYGFAVGAFDDSSVDMAAVYARLAAVALLNVRETSGLRSALQSRLIIGVAQGILMERYGLSLNRSFEVLRRRSQETNVKLREVARELVDATTAERDAAS